MQPADIRTVFMGTPDFACPSLAGLIDAGCNLVGVFTQPDRPSGRGRKLTPPPVKVLAEQRQIPVFQPEKLRRPEAVEQLRSLAPDLVVVVAYGQILSREVLQLPRFGCINVHASLLPKYRGAAPINRAIIDGETVTGVTTMYMDEGLDTGDMLIRKSLDIGPNETAGQLHDRLAPLGAEAMRETLQRLCAGTLERVPQNDAESCYASMMKKEDGCVDWSRPARQVHNLVRGLDPWPSAYTTLDGLTLKIAATSVAAGTGEPGTVLQASADGVLVACGEQALLIGRLQLPGKKQLAAADFLRGHALPPGTRLG
ncbi:methionyl-tRNA formyltransferase [Geothermobacter hydrogeniphilus]|uniref:Methionyl-tRNA formyltransferase n=1 Tax=Geothermobacter hydrogeniphilus TaxID=1969733 RepID=A0A2K2HEI3_9BACT|nr:methionyl-tRNA formyltransferase [Geothermobacter hydrogeniphilus]PNU21707.1 methionyl-tRNA formyltransferase [Geothermobacter hydrogeniphilus]